MLKWKFLVVPALLCSLFTSARAEAKNVLISGDEMDGTIQADLSALGYTSTLVDPGLFASTDFTGYDAIWLGWGTDFPGLETRQTDLLNFVQGGGNLLAEIADPVNDITDYPLGDQLTVVPNKGDSVQIVDPADPVNANLTDAGLSNWLYSFHDVFTDIGSFHGITVNGDDPSQWVTIDKSLGAGNIIYTGQSIDFHIKYGVNPEDTGPLSAKGTFLNNALSDPPAPLSPPSTVDCTPEPGSLALLAMGAGPMLLSFRRRVTRR